MKRRIRERKIILISTVIGLIIAGSITAGTYAYARETQAEIAESVIRFHVLANSDSKEDQELKLIVRDKILSEFYHGLAPSPSSSLEETKTYLRENLNEITACAQTVINEQGYTYPVTANIETSFFPTRIYGDVVFPPGEYEALRIEIGEAAGQNWWCVMFPPLCFVDLTQPVPEAEKEMLSASISDEGYKLLTHQERDDSVKVKFKIVEWWQNLFR